MYGPGTPPVMPAGGWGEGITSADTKKNSKKKGHLAVTLADRPGKPTRLLRRETRLGGASRDSCHHRRMSILFAAFDGRLLSVFLQDHLPNRLTSPQLKKK